MEESFPRGGVVKKPSHKETKRKPKEKDLFQIEEDGSKKTEKGRKRKKNGKTEKEGKKGKKRKVTPSKSTSFNTSQIQQLTFKMLSSDMLVLGCVKEVHDYEVILSLPNGLTGSVPITNISDAYHDQLKLLASQGETGEIEELDVHSLHEIFKIGTVLPCKVTSVGQNKKGKTSIKLSVNPKHVNQAFEPLKIRDGSVLFSSIASQEDHGYVVDLGVKQVKAFLKNKDAERYIQMYNNGYPLMVGQSVMCKVETGKDKLGMLSGESRTVTVTIDPNKVEVSEINDEMEIPFKSLIPGMKFTATVVKATEDGINVKFLQYSGSIHRSHLTMSPDKALKKKHIKACILYIHPTTKAVVMTTLPHLVDYKGVPLIGQFSQLVLGQIVEDAEVSRRGKSEVQFKLSDHVRGHCGMKNLSDRNIEDMENMFKRGLKHRCRILDFHYIDNLVAVTLKQSILDQKYMTIHDIHPGQLIECTVESFLDKGVAVKLTKHIRGFIPKMHLANSTFKSRETKEFEEGKQLKCRVLKVDEKKRNVILTHKKMLLNTKLPVLTNFDQLEEGMEVEGFIIKITDKGVLVAFYGELKGFVPKKHLSTEDIEFPEKVFFLGQVVKARVLSWSEENKKIALSFKIGARHSFGTKKDTSMDDLKIGQIFQCEVTEKQNTGLDVKLPSGKAAFLPIKHLTDSMETSDLLLDTYAVGDIIENAMFLNKSNVPIMTTRKSMVEYGAQQDIVTLIEDLQEGMVIPGSIQNIMSYGVFVQLVGHLTGLAPNKFALDLKIDDLNEVYRVGQSVIAKVTDVDKEKKRFLVNLRMKDCYHGDTEIGISLLSTYLNEMDRILTKAKEQKDKKKLLKGIEIGKLCEFVIKESSSDGVLGHLANGIVAMCTRDFMDEKDYTVGSKVQCVVLFIDVNKTFVEVTLEKHIVKAVKNKKETQTHKAEVGLPVEGEIILIRKDCVMVLLKGHLSGTIAYLPSRRHLNDVMEIHQYSVGATHPMIVKRIEDGHVICSLVVHEKQNKTTKNTTPAVLQVGDIVTVRITKKLTYQLNVYHNGVHGRIHITETADSIENGTNPLSKYMRNQKLKARVIGFRKWQAKKRDSLSSVHSKMIPEFSIKPSKLEKKNLTEDPKFFKGQKVIGYVVRFKGNSLWLQVTDTVQGRITHTNLSDEPEVLANTRKYFHRGEGYNATVLKVKKDGRLDLTLIDKSRKTPIETGSTCKGMVKTIRPTGLVVKLSGGGKGIVRLTEISDKYKDYPTNDYSIKQCVNCFVLYCNKASRFNLSLRKSRFNTCEVVDPVIASKDDLSEAQILRGFVVNCKKTHLVVSLGYKVKGTVKKDYVSDNCIDNLETAFSVGTVVTAKVLKISDSIELSLRESDTGVKEVLSKVDKNWRKSADEINGEKVIKKSERKKDDMDIDEKHSEEVKLKNRKRKPSQTENNANVSLIDLSKKLKVTSDSDSGIEDGTPEEISSKMEKTTEDKPCLNVKLGWCWDSEYKPPQVSKEVESDSDDDEDDDIQVRLKNTKKDIQTEKKDEEKMLFEFEQHQLEGDLTPETAEDFDRLTLQSPDSSLVWLRYMAFHLETAEIEKARAVAERALRTISFREEQEKMNVWVAYLNLENMYGSPEELAKILERALQQNEPLTIHQHLINIYIRSGKFQEAENTYNIMTRKFSYKKEPWIGFGLFHFKNGNFEAARKILPRCLKSLSKENHVETIAKFAQMEFKHGEPERGKTMFENILSNYPKRTDLWSVYVDMVIKTGDIEAVRQLLNRVIHMKLSAKKMKFFFKKYLDFEKSHGDDQNIEYVKKKAFEYVESKGFVDE